MALKILLLLLASFLLVTKRVSVSLSLATVVFFCSLVNWVSEFYCIPLCDQRCKAHSRKNICVRACMTCCDRCKCVPPGTYGNREKCGKCYTDMTTHGNKPKCP
ncbi:hypothetical protein PVL29_019179 [Vitis rotundifolia]|uniref:Gibberellin regulated protein n=1 Tax=Vitis rotundifolia TaxID=103349 RepID=A0AA38Z6T7_VITRO|nr:hypothetical protein PVL29_019179 [Vitis rotundifolia]